MIEIILLVLAVVVGVGIVMRMDVEPRDGHASEPAGGPVEEPPGATAGTAEVRTD